MFNNRDKLATFMPNSAPYTHNVKTKAGVPRVNPADPATRTAHFRDLYPRLGDRFATPVDVRLKAQLESLRLDVSHAVFSLALEDGFMNTIDDTRNGAPLMRSAFLQGHAPYLFPRASGTSTKTSLTGPPDRKAAAEAFTKLMTDFNDYHARVIYSPEEKSYEAEDLETRSNGDAGSLQLESDAELRDLFENSTGEEKEVLLYLLAAERGEISLNTFYNKLVFGRDESDDDWWG